ncbi:hypothetical protein [Prevotella sp. 10(H)]|uniref:DUF6913 domain-containing protein n=1 Tax=Prevotella sp. 10(H) TaxID=1158294 RepID=UPI001E65B6C1|nr:hypothetical protein [Prevotella sp. 10(H)]
MKKILILFNYNDYNEIKQIVEDLKVKGKEVTLWTVQPLMKDTGNTIFPQEVNIIMQKDISRWFGLSSRIVKEFKQLSYDTLLDLTTENNKTLLYLLANNTAEFCIGIRELDFKVYDLIILKEENANLPETYNQIKFYLNNIR